METETDIEHKQNRLMEWVKTDTAATGIIDGISQKMIQIHQHSAHHEKIGFLPLLAEKSDNDSSGNQKMQYQMKSNVTALSVLSVLTTPLLPAICASHDGNKKLIATPEPIFPALWHREECLPFRNCLRGRRIHTVAQPL